MSHLLPALPALLHVGFFYLESVAFPRSSKVQRLFLGKDSANAECVKVATVMLFNQGCYNLFLAIATLYGLYKGDRGVVVVTLWIYVAAAAALLFSSPKKFVGAAAQGVPALLALTLY